LDGIYVQEVLHALNDHFSNLPVFNVAKLFNPRHSPIDDSDQTMNIELRLKRILLKIQHTAKESDMCKG
jgi:hypothetical protein